MEISKAYQRESFYGWKNIVLLCLILSIASGFITFSKPELYPLMAEELAWTQNKTAFANTLQTWMKIIIPLLVAVCVFKIGARKTMQIGLMGGAVVFILLGLFITKTWQWNFAWGIMMPISLAFTGTLPIQTTINHWFYKQRGAATALSKFVFGILAFITLLWPQLIKQGGSWRIGWFIAAGFFLLGLFICHFIRNTPKEHNQHPDGLDPNSSIHQTTATTNKPSGVLQTWEIWSVKEVFNSRTIWFLLVCMLARVWALYLIMTHLFLHLTNLGFPLGEASMVLSAITVASGIAPIPAGIIADRIEPKILITIALLGMAMSFTGLWRTAPDGPNILVFGALFGFCSGSASILFLLLYANYYGPHIFPAINGILGFIIILFSTPVPIAASYIANHFGSYDLIFLPITIMLFVGTVLTWFLVPPQKKV